MPNTILYKQPSRARLITIFGILFLLLWHSNASAQPIPVGNIQEDQYRLLQLLSDSTVEISLNNRPIWGNVYQDIFEQAIQPAKTNAWWATPLGMSGKELGSHWRIGTYAPVFTNTINSDLPYGGNNGAAWYGRGLTSEFKVGAYITSKYFTATFRPHLIYTQNKDFSTPRFVPRNAQGDPRYMAIFSGIDMPFRFGPDSYSDFNLGQSSIRLHYKNIEAGLSNETLWWGPGIQNALMLSNNAPGLEHAFFGTRAPLSLPLGIGNLEFKFIWAKPEDSKYFITDEDTDRQRFSAGLNISYSPGFAPNLSVGLTRFSHRYIPDNGLAIDDFGATLPFFNTLQRRNPNDVQNQLVSAYFRWVFPESNAEVYGEYFREDAFYNIRDLFFEPDHDRAFTIGFQKVIESSIKWFDLFKVNGEINSLVPDRTSEVRPQAYYYSHGLIEQGHTNQGQVLGAAIGPGSASQFLGVDGYFRKGNIGLFVQRVAENDYFHFSFYNTNRYLPNGRIGPKDMWRHRINLNIGINGHYQVGPLLLGGKFVWNKNYNYGRYHYGEFDGINFRTVDKNDIINMHFQISARYYFN